MIDNVHPSHVLSFQHTGNVPGAINAMGTEQPHVQHGPGPMCPRMHISMHGGQDHVHGDAHVEVHVAGKRILPNTTLSHGAPMMPYAAHEGPMQGPKGGLGGHVNMLKAVPSEQFKGWCVDVWYLDRI